MDMAYQKSDQDALKKQAAQKAVTCIRSGMTLGLGTGSTTRFALQEIASYLASGRLKEIVGVASSVATEELARELSIPLCTLNDAPDIDLTIDGADEVDPWLNLIKGGGGALLREKVIAQASRYFIVIVDKSKLSAGLCSTFPLPVEVLPFAWKSELNYLQGLGAKVKLRTKPDGLPFVTDQENYILDADFKELSQPQKIADLLNARAGIMEHGLFLGMADEVVVASAEGISQLKANQED